MLEFLNLGTVNILSPIILCCGDCPVYGRMFISIPGLYPLDSSNVIPTLSLGNQQHFQALPNFPGGKTAVETTALGRCSPRQPQRVSYKCGIDCEQLNESFQKIQSNLHE